MIFFDVTKAASSGHRSGLMRVSGRLLQELGPAATPVHWEKWDRAAAPGDWFLTGELFNEAERPGFRDFLKRRPCPCAAIYYDAIPLKYPAITWPQSVARHPDYLKLLASFDRIWAISAASRDELLGFWAWQGVAKPPRVEVLALGSDLGGRAGPPSVVPPSRNYGRAQLGPPYLLSVGIIEPRKNQSFLLDVCESLWAEGREFELHLVGRANPHFGPPIVQRIRELSRRRRGLHYHAAASDTDVARLYARARASVFPTIAEGCGLPLLESLWQGVPSVCSDLPVLRENADGGGCLAVPVSDHVAWKEALSAILTDDALHARLVQEAVTRTLPTWRQAARQVVEVISGK